ncbi:MAG TPA: L-serine ammonia-lyase, iron-sulfur-dependent subunit beta [Myxococcaceae bacterium]|nr:L-serine ammonia-lyase, iron-sulfur-dependent subunit beta [Myxococcaceae bacterium]
MSILDMIGPVMIGPSSSHTAGACRIGLLARAILDAPPEKADIALHGSFAKTGRGHGTDRALVAGLLGFRPDDGRLPDALAEADRAGLVVTWTVADLGNVHPNSVRLTLHGTGRGTTVLGSSIGGGAVEISEIDGVPVRFSGARHTLLVGHQDFYGAIATVTRVVADDRVNIASLSSNRDRRGGDALMCLELDARLSEPALGWIARIHGMHWVRMLPPVMDEG